MNASSATSGRSSAFTKMRQVYWEAKQSFNKSLGQREDDFIVSSDNDLDTRIELLQAADSSFNALMTIIIKYYKVLEDLVSIQENFGSALNEYGIRDLTAAGKIMCMSGRAISKSAQRHIQLKTNLAKIFNEVKTFQFKATADALQTVAKMEKARKSYRSGLMWMKNESTDLDPDVNRKLRNFRKVQEHIKRLKVKFDGVKLESMQKIDLFLLSRTNLFSYTLMPYCKTLKKIAKHAAIFMDYTLEKIPLCLSYNFVALKELNQYSEILKQAFQKGQSMEYICENEKNKDKTEISASPSDETVYMYPAPENSSNLDVKRNIMSFGDITDNKTDCVQTNETQEKIPLIDLSDGERNNALTKLSAENKNQSSSQYSEDLQLINFDNCQTTNKNELFTDDIRKIFEESLSESNSQGDSAIESEKLKYWSLLQTYDQKSNIKKQKNDQLDGSVLCPNHFSSMTSDSKWDNILIQFDPFLEETIDPKIKSDCLGSC